MDDAAPLWRWMLRGARAAASVPTLILISAFVGFAGLARGAGLPLAEAVFMTAIIWALPAQVVLIGAVLSGASLPAAAFAVALSSVRLMPMVVSIVPEMRAERTRRWVLYLVSHFVAVTAWVLGMERLRHVPPAARTSYFAGIGLALVCTNVAVVVTVYLLAARLPESVSAALIFLTPIYFLVSLWGSAREAAGRFAMIFGLVLAPLFHYLTPGLELLMAGLAGGFGAYGVHLLAARRRTR